MSEDTQIRIEIADVVKEHAIESLLNELELTKLKIDVYRYKVEPYAAVEWIIPTMIATYLLKPYFEGFLNEMGKDHYEQTKKWSKEMVKNIQKYKSYRIAASTSPNKLNKQNTQSSLYSYFIQMKDQRMVKLLFDEELMIEDWLSAIDKFIEYGEEHYENYPNDKLLAEINKINDNPQREYYCIIDKVSKDLKFFSIKQLILISHESTAG